MKDLPNDIVTEIDADEKAPIILLEQYLDDLTLRWARAKADITFPAGGSVVYYARAFDVPNIEVSAEGQIDRIEVSVDNVNGDFDAYLESYVFEGKLMQVKRIYLSGENEEIPTDALMYNEIFYGEMELPDFTDETQVTFGGVAGDAIEKQVLDKYYGSTCQHIFGDANCHVNLFDASHYYASGETTGGSTSLVKTNALMEAEDFWKYGLVKVTQSGTTYRRKVKSFSSDGSSGEVHPDIGFPVSIGANNFLEIEKGCDFKWDTCKANNNWGPSGENINHFLGFIHIGVNREN